MADADRIAAALRYQQELEAAQRPATMNPNLAAQGEAYRANMTPPTSVMDPRYPAWKKNQDAADAVGAVGDLALSAIPMAGPALQGVKAAARFAGPELARGLENYMVKTGGILPMDTWHGTPHRFPPTAKNPLGEFDAAKIGTGEGAQAYGHGLYLAENPGVATDYAKTLGPKTALSNPEYVAAQTRLAKFEDAVSKRYKQDALSPMEDIAFYSEKYPKRVINAADKIQTAEQAAYEKASKGNLYKVDLPDEQIAKMLDYDKPLSQQPKSVQAALSKYDADMYHPSGADYDPNETGQQIINRLAGTLAVRTPSPLSGQDLASQWLNNNGIPGIRYLDQGSRAGGAGTSNFVVFDPKNMNIIGRE